MGCSELNLGIYDASFRYEEAERLYFAGKIDEAITVLDSEKLPPSAGKNIADAVQSWRLKGQLLTLKYQFEDA
jgi:hypothetical protein